MIHKVGQKEGEKRDITTEEVLYER